MDQKENENLNERNASPPGRSLLKNDVNRRQAIKYGLIGLAGLAGVGSMAYYITRSARTEGTVTVFKNDAPKGEL